MSVIENLIILSSTVTADRLESATAIEAKRERNESDEREKKREREKEGRKRGRCVDLHN